MGGNEVSFWGLTIESTQVDALEGLEANPLEKDVRAIKGVVVWRGKVRELQENSRFWVCYHRDALVWAFFWLIQEIQVMQCMLCHPMPSASTFSRSPRNTRHKIVTLLHIFSSLDLDLLLVLPPCTPSFRIAQGFFLLVDSSCSWGIFCFCFDVVGRNRAWCHLWLNVWLV